MSWTLDLPATRERLLAERARTRASLDNDPIVAPGPMTYGSQAAAASQVFEQQRDLALREKEEQHLEAVDAALARVDAGTYGHCTTCEGQIAAERLDALPWAALCIECQRLEVRRR
jgi:RNA polymerase-binding transcription factor